MSAHHHHEHHKQAPAGLRDFVIGMADGLTVPFALAAGLAGAVDATTLIITAGSAEIAAGAVAMGLGGYLGARTEKEHYEAEEAREWHEVEHLPHVEEKEVADIFREYGLAEEHLKPVVNALKQDKKKWVDFMMRFELGLERPDPKRIVQSPLIIGSAYVLGGIIPLSPYFLIPDPLEALKFSVVITLMALVAFGTFKGHFTGQKKLRTALHTTMIGALAAAVAYGVASFFS